MNTDKHLRCFGFHKRSNGYIPKVNLLQDFIDKGYKFILLRNTEDYEVFTMLRLKRERNDGLFLLETTDGNYLVLSKWDFAEHVWDTKKEGWRSTDYGSIKFIFD